MCCLGGFGVCRRSQLGVCEQAGVTLYAPVSENDFSEAKRKKGKKSQLPKKEFTWLSAEQTYQCPEGHQFVKGKTVRLEELVTAQYFKPLTAVLRSTAWRAFGERLALLLQNSVVALADWNTKISWTNSARNGDRRSENTLQATAPNH